MTATWIDRTARALAAVAFGAAALSAGAGQASAYSLDFQQTYISYDRTDLTYAGEDGRPVWTVIIGNPFGGSKELLDTTVLDAMKGSHFGRDVTFATQPGPETRRAYRVVMLLNGSTKNAYNICRYYPSYPLGPGDHGNSIQLVAVFCRGEKPSTIVSARMGNKPMTDPEFAQMVRQVTVNLFPPQNIDQNRRGSRFR